MITKKIKITAGAFALMALFPFKVYASDTYDIVFNQALVLRPATVAMAAIGAAISYGYPDDESSKRTRKRIVWGMLWSTFFALVLTSVGIDFMSWDWADKRQAPLAGLIAVILPAVWPMLKNAIPGFLRNFGDKLAGKTDTIAVEPPPEESQDNADS